jgi:predicted transcriptional regulator
MTTKTSPKPNHIPLSAVPETPDERAARSRHEAALIAQGEADFGAGDYYDDDEVEAFLDQLEIDPKTPLPPPRPKTPLK